ncbi:MAG: mannitol dehydrogenase family protein [Planctomycetota bacterium]
MAKKRKIVQFGAGNIGRSLVGQLFSSAGWEVVFVETRGEVVEALNRERAYVVRVKDKVSEDIRVENVRGVHAGERERIAAEIADADCIGTAVGPTALPHIFETLAAGLARRKTPVSIIMCENLRGGARIAREGCLRYLPAGFDVDAVAGFVETSIGKMVPIMPAEVSRRDPLEVWAERYNRIVADADAFVGPEIDVPGVEKHHHFEAHVDRKLFIHNLGHATCAYHGSLAVRTFIWEAMEVGEIERATRAAMWESGNMLIARYPQVFDEGNQREHIEDLLGRFRNRALGDTVYRVGRDLKRKLGPNDRFVPAMRLDLQTGIEPIETVLGFAAGFLFKATDEKGEMFPGDAEFHELLESAGFDAVLHEVCGITKEDDPELFALISKAYVGLRRE